MTRDEAATYCRARRKQYMSGFDDPREAVEVFDSLIAGVESGGIQPEQLPLYDMAFDLTDAEADAEVATTDLCQCEHWLAEHADGGGGCRAPDCGCRCFRDWSDASWTELYNEVRRLHGRKANG